MYEEKKFSLSDLQKMSSREVVALINYLRCSRYYDHKYARKCEEEKDMWETRFKLLIPHHDEVEDELERARDRIKTQKSEIAILADKNKKLEKAAEDANTTLEQVSDEYSRLHRRHYDLCKDLDVIKGVNKTIKENAAKLMKEKDELIKVLNIYQAIADIDYDFLTDTAIVRLNGADGAGRAFIHDGDAARALYSAYVKYHDNSFKYKPGEKPDYKMSNKEKDEWIVRDMFASACYSMESLAKSADALAIHLQKRQVYLANPKSLKVPVEFMLEDARYNFPFLREKRVWVLDTCRTNVIRIVVMYGKGYYYDFNKQSLTPIDALMED